MFVDEKPFIWVWRPFYRRVYTPLYLHVVGPVMDRIFERIAQRLGTSAISTHRVMALTASNPAPAADPLALEHLVLAMIANNSKDATRIQRADSTRNILERLHMLEDNVRAMTERMVDGQTEADDRWLAIEQLILSGLANDVRSQPAADSTSVHP